MLLRWWITKHGDDLKQAAKLAKNNFREAEGITKRVRTSEQNETKGIAK